MSYPISNRVHPVSAKSPETVEKEHFRREIRSPPPQGVWRSMRNRCQLPSMFRRGRRAVRLRRLRGGGRRVGTWLRVRLLRRGCAVLLSHRLEFESSSAIQPAMRSISGSRMPRVVTAGVPTRIPPAFIGGSGSKGMEFLLIVMPARSKAGCAALPVRPLEWMSIRKR